jgi:carotenoid cleavage dioxygenase-like enzyme
MTTATKSSTRKAWAKAIIPPATEFPPTQLPIISGKIPQGLRGTLYRNGPGRLERGGVRVGHWFDGDGAILAVHFNTSLGIGGSPLTKGGQGGSNATAVYRYVQTSGYLEESQAGKFLYGNYGMTAPGPIWNQWLKPVKNAANTSVLALPDKLLALWEGGKPHALDLQTLETKGLDNLSGLSDNLPYSAHPKCDPKTGEIFNFGISPGINSILNIYKSDSTGKIIQTGRAILEGLPLIHDFVLAGQYLVFFIPPVRINLLSVLTGFYSYSDAMEWKPQLGTQVLIFDRETLSLVSRGETEPWFQWHFSNGYVDDRGSIVIDFVRFEDFTTNQRLKQVAAGETNTVAEGTFWQVFINPETGLAIASQQLLDRACEFPIVPPSQVGHNSRYTYLSMHRKGADIGRELFGAIACFDHHTQTLTAADLGDNRYPTEPIYAPDAENSEKGWILTVVYDGNSDTSEVWVFDSLALDSEPVCKLGLPSVIPPGFHGTWRAL